MGINEDDQDRKPIELLFVYDTFHGEGEYEIGSDSAEVNTLIRCVRDAGLYKPGIACFRCNELLLHTLVSAVMKSFYCHVFDVSHSSLFISLDDQLYNIKYVRFDTESG